MPNIHIINFSSDILENSYEDGELRSTGCGYQNEPVGKSFDDMQKAISYLNKTYGMPGDVKDYEIDHSEIFTSMMVADHSAKQNGGWMEPTRQEKELWMQNKFKLYSENFRISFLTH